MAREKVTNPEDRALRDTLPVVIIGYIIFVLTSLAWQFAGRTLDNRVLAIYFIAISIIIPFVIIFSVIRHRLQAIFQTPGLAATFNQWFYRTFVLSLALAILFGTAGLLLSVAVSAAFKQFVYGPITIAIWPALLAGFWTYFTINYAQKFKPDSIINIAGFYLIGGVGLSAILNPNPQWWDESISYLGMNKLPSAKIFNIALIFSGALLLTLSSFILKDRFDVLHARKLISKRSLNLMKFVFIVAPIGLACVGIFPFRPEFPSNVIHNLSAYSAFGLFGLVVFLTYWLMPFFSKYYMRTNYALLALLVLIMGLNVSGYLTLALTEVMGFGVIALWMVLFLRSLNGIIAEKA